MVERISSTTRYQMLIADMKMNEFNFNKLTAQLSSGNKYQNITDNPIASVNILNTNRQLGQIQTFEQNVGMASAELSALDDLLDLANGYLSSAWDKAIQANNQTYGKSSLEALKVEIDEITKTMVDLANTQYNDNYIFSGANTKTLTYTVDDKGNVIYNGTPQDNPDYVRQTEVADGVFEVINTTGDKVFGYYKEAVGDDQDVIFTDVASKKRVIRTQDEKGNDVYKYENGVLYEKDPTDPDVLRKGADEEAVGVFGALRKLSNGLEKCTNDDDSIQSAGYDEINKTLDMFSSSLNAITTEQTKFGGVYNRLEMTTSTLETNNENLTSYLQNINSVDYAEAITQWMNAQYAYQASMQITSASMNMSLLNYIQ